MKRWKKFIIYALVGIMVSTATIASYDKASTVKAVAIADDVLIVGSVLAAMGIVYVGTSWYGSNLAEDWWDDYGDEMDDVEGELINLWDNEIWLQYANGNIPNPDDFDPENDSPEENPPTWTKLKEWIKSNPDKALGFSVSSALTGILANVKDALESSMYLGKYIPSEYLEKCSIEDFSNVLSSFPYTCILRSNSSELYQIFFFNKPIYLYEKPNGQVFISETSMYVSYYSGSNSISGSSELHKSNNLSHINYWHYDGGNIPYYLESEIPENYGIVYPNPINDETSLRTTKQGDLEVGGINLPVNGMLTVGQTELAKLLNSLYNAQQLSGAEKETAVQNAVDEFVSSVEPSTDTGGSANPDIGGDTGGDSGGDSEGEVSNSTFTADLTKLFPFCIPFDLVNCIKLFNAEPEAPRIEAPMHFPIVDIDYTFVIDLEEFDSVAMVCRTCFLVMYMVGLVLATRNLIRG